MKPVLEGAKNILVGSFREKWGELTSNEIAIVEGQQQRLHGILKSREAREELIQSLAATQN